MAELTKCDTCGKVEEYENWPDIQIKHGRDNSPPLFSGSWTWTQVIGGFLSQRYEEATICDDATKT